MTHKITPDKPTLFFVGGQGKSGTTWIQLMLNAHPDISCHGEGHFSDQFLPLLQQAYDRYGEFLTNNNRSFGELKPYVLPGEQELTAVARVAILQRMHTQNPGRVLALGERTPANIDGIPQLSSLFPQAKFVHCVRDPRDVAVSLWFHGLRTQNKTFSQRYPTLPDLSVALAPAWREGIMRARAQDLRERYIEVQFEQAKKDTKNTLQKLCVFLDIKPTTHDLENCVQRSSFETLSGRISGAESQDSHFRKGIVGDWENHLGNSELAVFRRECGELMNEFGYI